MFCSFWWQLCLKPKYTLGISFHHTKFHWNRATGLGFLLHTADASWLFFKCQYRGDPDFQSRSLLKTEQSLPQDLPPHKISGKLVVRQKSFTPYATFTDRPRTDGQTDGQTETHVYIYRLLHFTNIGIIWKFILFFFHLRFPKLLVCYLDFKNV